MRGHSNDGLPEDVLAYLLAKCRGKASRIRRKDLVWAMKTCGHLKDLSDDVADRRMRHAISGLRRNHELGSLICGSSSASGYWIANTALELEEVLAEEDHRGRSILERVNQQRRRGLDAMRALPLEQGRLL